MTRRPSRVIAIGIDAATGWLVRRFADDGHLPAIAKLAAQHGWGTVTSPASIGSGAVWPTFMTGQPAEAHGIFGEHAWTPESMTLRRPTFNHLAPFWSDLAAAGRNVAVVDVPFAPVLGRDHLVEIADWGAHDWFGGSPVVRPPALESALGDAWTSAHPLVGRRPVDSASPDDVEGLRYVAQSCAAGSRLRGDLAIRLLDVAHPELLLVIFPEAHRASHMLWHTIDPGHPVWKEGIARLPDDVMSGLLEVFRAIDEQIGRLVAHDGGSATTLVFSLHGMKASRGVPAFLSDVLERWGVAVRRRWWQRSGREHLEELTRSIKAKIPAGLKAVYYGSIPRAVTMRLAQPSMPVPAWDWSRTRAFSIPSDQHGWIRINLAGRESRGSVPASAYEGTCHELRARLLTLASAEGPLVEDVSMTAVAAPPRHVPDLVVHWSPLASRSRLRLVDPPLDTTPISLKGVGQHDADGFFLVGGSTTPNWPLTIDAAEIGPLLKAALSPTPPSLDPPKLPKQQPF